MNTRNRVFIIAEAGINHNGSLDNCFRLIDSAKNAGCDAIKFQFFKAGSLYPVSAGKLDWKDKNGACYSYDIHKAVKSFELPVGWINKIIEYCSKRNIRFICSVFDKQGAAYLVKKGVQFIKLSSYSVTDQPLLDYCSKLGLPVLLSTGAATLAEVDEAVRILNIAQDKLSLLHCSTKYPTKLKDCNLGVIETLRMAFPKNKIGFSDHTKETSIAALGAVSLGAVIIEKHITLDKNMPGPDHFFALEPRELNKMVADIRLAGRAKKNRFFPGKTLYGASQKKIFEQEKYLRNFCLPSIFLMKAVRKGEVIKSQDLKVLRTGKKKPGLPPKYMELFTKFKIRAARDIAKEEPVSWEMILNA